ncbi:hypothetical protein Mgra_00002878 [Meloidogyne graminicola]|uniref:Uncharacterized protein n=1 Tax=Meloidogyne graminicola TaxID=189291 RepID=A0A8S9ZVF5_9BILA|nr:hypothetical protein Mgra_00002878 [Meloidogyne graminicola]
MFNLKLIILFIFSLQIFQNNIFKTNALFVDKVNNCEDYNIVERKNNIKNNEHFILYKFNEEIKKFLKENKNSENEINNNSEEYFYINYKNNFIYIFPKCLENKEWEEIVKQGIELEKAKFSNIQEFPRFNSEINIDDEKENNNNLIKSKRSQTDNEIKKLKLPKIKFLNLFKNFINKNKITPNKLKKKNKYLFELLNI